MDAARLEEDDMDIKDLIIDTYRTAIANGAGSSGGAQAVWKAIKRAEGYRHLRAPCWSEQVWLNTSSRRSYRCPLACVLADLGLCDAWLAREFGGYCAFYPRTKRSRREADNVLADVLTALDRLAGLKSANDSAA